MGCGGEMGVVVSNCMRALACNDARRTAVDWISDSCQPMYLRCLSSQKDGSTRRARPREEMHKARMSSCVSRYRYEITCGERENEAP